MRRSIIAILFLLLGEGQGTQVGQDAIRDWIGPAGGQLVGPGLVVTFPPGSLSEERLISAEVFRGTRELPALYANSLTPFLGSVALSPDGAEFDELVTVTIGLNAALPPGTELALLLYREDIEAWSESTTLAVVNPDGQTATFHLSHFSTYVVDMNDLDSASIFGEISDLDTIPGIFQKVKTRFTAKWLLGDPIPIDPGEDPKNKGKDLFNCYVPVGMELNLDHDEIPGVDNPLNEKILDTEGFDFAMKFHRFIDINTQIEDIILRVVGDFTVTVFFKSVPPELQLQVSTDGIWVTQQAQFTASLTCGGKGFKDQEVDFEITASADLGSLDPLMDTTSTEGVAETTFSANDAFGGISTVTATYPWTRTSGDPGFVLEDSSDIEVFSLTGEWFGSGTGTDFNCEDPEDNGTGPGSGEGAILQAGFSFSGGGEGVTFEGTVTPLEGDDFIVNGTYSGEESAGIFNGSGSVRSGQFGVNFSGAGSGCSESGGGTLERL